MASSDELGPAIDAAIDSGRTWVLEITTPVPLPVVEPAMRALHAALRHAGTR